MTIEHWPMDESLKKELDAHYKTTFALSLATREPLDIAKELTFDGLANTVTVPELVRFLTILNKKFAKGKIRGVGLEVGSGPGTFVALLATLPGVEKVYGVEACEAVVRELMMKVVSTFAPNNTDAVVGAVGDFNRLALPDASVDFVFDFFSLHHSANPTITFAELARVLKPGGVLICVDKARANRMSESELDALLNVEYSEKAKIAMGVDPKALHTRRMNGEFEYRLRDWNRYALETGFASIEHHNVARVGGSVPIRILKGLISGLSPRLQSKISRYISKAVANHLEPSNRIFSNMFPSYPRDFSLMITTKQ